MKNIFKKYVLLIVLILGIFSISFHINEHVDGFNLRIYKFFSQLVLNNKNPYIGVSDVFDTDKLYQNPKYLDYSGFQLLLYVCMEYASIKLERNIYSSYSQLLFIVILILSTKLLEKHKIKLENYILFIFFLNQGFLFEFLFNRSFEDKFTIVLFPLLFYYLKNKYIYHFILGICVGWMGIIAPYLIAKLKFKIIYYSKHFYNQKLFIALFLIGLFISLIPFFPDSLIGWERRSERMSLDPFWWSIFHVFDFYFKNLNKIAIFISISLVSLLFLNKKITELDFYILIISFPFSLNNFTGPQHIVPLSILFIFLYKNRISLTIYSVFLIVYVLYLKDNYSEYPTKEVVVKESLFLLSPAILSYAYVIISVANNIFTYIKLRITKE